MDSYPEATITWYVNGIPITPSATVQPQYGPNESTLTIKKVHTKEIEYTVKAENEVGYTTRRAKVILEKPEEKPTPISFFPKLEKPMAPRIVQDIVEIEEIEEINERILRFKVDAKPSPKFTWYLDNVELKPGPTVDIRTYETTTELRISTVIETEKIVKVVAQNVAGVAESTFRLKPRRIPVEYRPGPKAFEEKVETTTTTTEQYETKPHYIAPKITRHLEDELIVEKDETVVLKVEAIGQPAPDFKWYINEIEIKPTASVQIVSQPYASELHISRTTLPRAEYKVVAKNVVGEATSRVVVRTKPGPKPMHPGTPVPKAFTETEIIEEERYFTTKKEVEQYPPKFIKPLIPTEVLEDTPLELTAVVDAKPASCTFTWYLNDVEIKPQYPQTTIKSGPTSSTLTIKNVDITKAGEYSVVARNVRGYALSMARVNVAVKGQHFKLNICDL